MRCSIDSCWRPRQGSFMVALLLLMCTFGSAVAKVAPQPSPVCSEQQLCTCYNSQNLPACYNPNLYHCVSATQLRPGPEPSGQCLTVAQDSAHPSPVCTDQQLCTCFNAQEIPACYHPSLYHCVGANQLLQGPELTGACSIGAAATLTPHPVTSSTGHPQVPAGRMAAPQESQMLSGAGNQVVLFHDDFKTLNSSNWAFDIGDGSDYGIPGWGNQELQCYTSSPENAAIVSHPEEPTSTVLRIRSLHHNPSVTCLNDHSAPVQKQWTSAKLVTKNLHSFVPVGGPAGCQPIVVEARMKLPWKKGHWSAFWMLPQNSTLGWPKGGEIDIMEHINHSPEVLGTVHLGNAVGLHMQAPGNNQIPMTPAALQGFNTYKLVWGCDTVSWYVNDKLGLTVLKSELPNWPFDQPFYIIMNLAVGGNLPGNDVDLSGGDLLVEYVKVYSNAT